MLLRGDRLLLKALDRFLGGYKLLKGDRLLGGYRLLEGDRLLRGDRRLLISHVNVCRCVYNV